jgi:hypothetical protein
MDDFERMAAWLAEHGEPAHTIHTRTDILRERLPACDPDFLLGVTLMLLDEIDRLHGDGLSAHEIYGPLGGASK